MPRKQTKNLSNVNGAVWVPVVPIDQQLLVDGVTCFTVSIEFTPMPQSNYRCRIGKWYGPWRGNRGEAMRDMQDNIKLRMKGRPWTRERDYEVRALTGVGTVTDVPQGKPTGFRHIGGQS